VGFGSSGFSSERCVADERQDEARKAGCQDPEGWSTRMITYLLFPILFIVAFIFWWLLGKITNKVLDHFERQHADHHRS
jgi:hypothetical protein